MILDPAMYVYANFNHDNFSVPLGIQYEELEHRLQDRINRKYNIIDHRNGSQICTSPKLVNNRSYIDEPAIKNIFIKEPYKKVPLPYKMNDQSRITFEEPNTKPVYPVSTIPYSQGVIWE